MTPVYVLLICFTLSLEPASYITHPNYSSPSQRPSFEHAGLTCYTLLSITFSLFHSELKTYVIHASTWRRPIYSQHKQTSSTMLDILLLSVGPVVQTPFLDLGKGGANSKGRKVNGWRKCAVRKGREQRRRLVLRRYCRGVALTEGLVPVSPVHPWVDWGTCPPCFLK